MKTSFEKHLPAATDDSCKAKTNDRMNPVKIFISYSHKDEALMEEFFEFLQPLKYAGRIDIWSDRAIGVGNVWDEEIKAALEASKIIILLISPSFLASTYINRVEITRAFELRKDPEKKAIIVPLMLRPCDLDSHIVPNEEYKISDFHGMPKNMKPIIKWETHEDGWIDAVISLKALIQKIQITSGNQENHGLN